MRRSDLFRVSSGREAESLPTRRDVVITFFPQAEVQFMGLAHTDRQRLVMALARIQAGVLDERRLQDLPDVDVYQKENGLYVLRWSADGRALFRIEYRADSDSDIRLNISAINRKKIDIEPVDLDEVQPLESFSQERLSADSLARSASRTRRRAGFGTDLGPN
jgi:hypothetical protein